MNKWCTIAPIAPGYDDAGEPFGQSFDLGHDVAIVPTPAWLRDATVVEGLGDYEAMVIEASRHSIVATYEARDLGEPDPDPGPDNPRSVQDAALDKIKLANIALWLARPTSVGFDFALHLEHAGGMWCKRQYIRTPRIRPVDGGRATFTDEELALARGLFEKIIKLERSGAVWTAVRALFRALREDWWEYRYLMFWIVLESIYGPKQGGEVGYRISQRISLFLASDREDASKIFEAAKRGYKWRSQVVHGLKLTKLKEQESRTRLVEAENFARLTIIKLLGDEQLTETFNGEKRDDFLDGLVFE